MRTRTRITLAALALGAALAGGAAWATIPSAEGTIHGCYKVGKAGLDDPNKGQLRVVDGASDCKNNEAAISWNEQGVPGAAGATGPAGPAGAQGEPGAAGSNGTDGAKGDPCLATDPACVGPKGDTGTAGTNGTDGQPGTNGTNGTDGLNGAPGAQGDTGPTGGVGLTGPAGPTGPTGMTGPSGATTTYTTRRAPGVGREARVDCLPGEQVTGGGAYTDDVTRTLTSSYPINSDGNSANATEPAVGWVAATSLGSTYVIVFVICAS